MRINKDYDERRSEILKAAMQLFGSKGYAKTTINDILKEVQIAKGTFYYYFKSKEEVLDAIIEEITNVAVLNVQMIINKQDLNPIEKLIRSIMALNVKTTENECILEELHAPENALMHQKSLKLMVEKIAPMLASIVEEGIQQGVFKKKFTQELAELFLAAALTITDQGIFEYTKEKEEKMVHMVLYVLEMLLGLEEGAFERVLSQS